MLPLVDPVGPCVCVWAPYALVVPYRKYQVVGSPFGLIVPLSRAEVWVMFRAPPVDADGSVAEATPTGIRSAHSATVTNSFALIASLTGSVPGSRYVYAPVTGA